jgi:capsid protein
LNDATTSHTGSEPISVGSWTAVDPVGPVRVSDAYVQDAPYDPERIEAPWKDGSYGRAHFESSETDRLNQAHWAHASDEPINQVLERQLPTIRQRSNYEAINNPHVEGLILSHTLAVAGEDGPLIDLHAEDAEGDRWCEEAEEVWEEWARASDAAGELTLASRIKQWNRSCWTNGEWLDQFVSPRPAELRGPRSVRMRLHGIEPARLGSPHDALGNPDIVMGVHRNRFRAPRRYHIYNNYYYWAMNGEWIRAENILHGFDRMETDQARGVPWCQTGLPTAADVRDYDLQVMDAARSAADMALVAYTQHPDAEFYDDVPKSVGFRRRRINFMVPGWQVQNLQSHQPTAQYKDHRHERMGDLGLGRGVPSMVTRLDAREHNYSSARFDYSLLNLSAKHCRAVIYNPRLHRLVMLVLSEAQLAGLLRPPPVRFFTSFVWPAMPQIDEDKSAKAEERYLKLGTLSYSEACVQRHGRRARDVISRRRRDARMLEEAGLPSVQESSGSGSSGGDTDPPDPRTSAEAE